MSSPPGASDRGPCVTVADSFLEAARSLDHEDAKRVAAFVGKLLAEPTAAGLRPEIVRDAHDRSVRSYRVSRELRAVGRVDGADTTFLYVGPHEKAYAWARSHCIDCHLDGHSVRLAGSDEPGQRLREWACVDRDQLCDVLDAHGVAHDLR